MNNNERYKVRELEDLLAQIERYGMIGDTIKAVHYNTDDFNYTFIDGRLDFHDGVVFFVDTAHELADSGREDPHSFPLGIEETAPFREDYVRHPSCYNYLLCRHGEAFWLSVIRHEPGENGAERFMENALSVIREFLSVKGVKTLRDIERMNASAKIAARNRKNQPRTFYAAPRPAAEVVNIVK